MRVSLKLKSHPRHNSAPFGPPSGIALPEVPGQFAMKSIDCQLAHNAATTPRKYNLLRKKRKV
jgi:hypothetical protein